MRKADDIKNIAIIGAGLMGHGLAQVFASKNYNVYIYARRKEALPEAIEKVRANLTMMVKGGIKLEPPEKIISRIKTSTSMEEATADAHFVIESIAENMELKQNFFKDLDRMCSPDTILTSNTSVMSITEIASKSIRKDRIVGTHFWNPPYIIPLVEVVKTKDTSDHVFETTYNLLKNAGKHPVKVLKDVPGFLANRLQHALVREAMSIVEHGIADPASVDEAIKNSFGIRLGVLGPMEGSDMVGMDMVLAIQSYICKYLESSPNASPILKEKVDKGELGFKTGQGFFKWNKEDITKSRERLLTYLIDWAKREQDKAK